MQKCKQSTCFQTDCSAEMKGELIREILFLEKLKNFKHVVGIIVAAIIIINDVILIITRGAQELQMRGIHLFLALTGALIVMIVYNFSAAATFSDFH